MMSEDGGPEANMEPMMIVDEIGEICEEGW